MGKEWITVLDIGSSKISGCVAAVSDGVLSEVVAFSSLPCQGLRHGVVVHIEQTVQVLQELINDLKMQTPKFNPTVFVGVTGSHIRSTNSHGIVPVRGTDVVDFDVSQVIASACAVAIPSDQKVLHIIPQEFILDGVSGIQDPLTMTGVRLEVKIHMVTVSENASQNLLKCLKSCSLKLNAMILTPLANCMSVLNQDEREQGICVVDMGSGTADLGFYFRNYIFHTACLPLGGDRVTQDLAMALRISSTEAEQIKTTQSVCYASHASEHDQINDLSHHSGKPITQKFTAQVIQARYEEQLNAIKNAAERSGISRHLSRGFVFTGGASSIEGFVSLASDVLNAPVRLGVNESISNTLLSGPEYTTLAGLVEYAISSKDNMHRSESSGFNHSFKRIKQWLIENF